MGEGGIAGRAAQRTVVAESGSVLGRVKVDLFSLELRSASGFVGNEVVNAGTCL